MKFRINWTEHENYYTEVEAESAIEARRMLETDELTHPVQSRGCPTLEMNSIKVLAVCQECGVPTWNTHFANCSKRALKHGQVMPVDCEPVEGSD